MVKINFALRLIIELFSHLRVFNKGKLVPDTPIPRGIKAVKN